MELEPRSGRDPRPGTARLLAAMVLGAVIVATLGTPAAAQTGAPDDPCASGFDDVPGPCPDLSIDSAEYSIEGRLLTITADVSNTGDEDSTSTRIVAEGGGGVLRGDTPVDPIARDDSISVSIRIEIPDGFDGHVDVALTIDPDDEIDEYDDFENNRFDLAVEVPPDEPTTTTDGSIPTPTDTSEERPTAAPPTEEDGIPTWVWVAGGGLLLLIVVFAALRFAGRRPRQPPPPPTYPAPEPEARPPTVEGATPPPVPPASAAPPATVASAPPTPTAAAEAPPPPPPAEPPVPADRPRRTVSTGVSSHQDPGRPVDPDTTLRTGARAFFWLEVGAPIPGSIEVHPSPLPTEHLPAVARLDVTLAALGRGPRIRIEEGSAELLLIPSGEVTVERQPDVGSGAVPPAPELAERRLFFDVEMPGEPGTYRMRCGIYHRNTLVQSRLVTLVATDEPRPQAGALRSEVDYTLSASLDPRHLGELPPHRVSLMLNHSAEDTHDLLVLGEGGVRMDLPLDAGELANLIRVARGGLRLASWASEDEWDLTRPYRYVESSRERLRIDLATMAIRGSVLYAKILEVAAANAGYEAVERLKELLRTPGAVQVALGGSARRVFPAGLVYDFLGIDTTLSADAFALCPTFVSTLDAGMPLDVSPCFTTGCDTPGRRDVVCPSGFWGLRHELGLPVSEREGDTRATIDYAGAPAITVAVSTDDRLQIRPAHEQTLRALWGAGPWTYADSRASAIAAFKEHASQVVYLYCHGGVTPIGQAYVQVGPLNEREITAAVLANEDVRWRAVRPLVFINGCHTTALEPEKAFELVAPLVALQGAIGVIGTEITIFEPLARDFAEAFLRRFLTGATLGAAVRGARLDLLAAGNPLGLAYIPFALPGLRLRPI